VRSHQYVARVGQHREFEQRRVIEDDQAGDEHGRCHERMADDAQEPRMDHLQQHLARSEAPVAADVESTHGQCDRCTQHQQERNDHHQAHVLHHVSAEVHPSVHARPPAGDKSQGGTSGQPPRQAAHRPAVTTSSEPKHTADIQTCCAGGGGEPEQIRVVHGEVPPE
jgi:hypothetical protein